ncbi:MAG: ABC transporter ATP-binding protein [Zetaproteobacteria bacterium]|nr:ABC transporter ATP-binding protein [Pseudobdellovibrionaceae bacterium]
MAKIEVKNLGHSYNGRDQILKTFDFTWEDGTTYALLGPSGCGKTTLLNILSGLIKPSQGQVLIDGKEVSSLGPDRRNIGQVFQFPVVYESMTVRQNLEFPLRRRQVSLAHIKDRVEKVSAILELEERLDNTAASLPPHMKQLISLGRGLVREDINAILLDEPLTTIDPGKKAFIRRKLREFHYNQPVTMILVTHDQTEALTFADQVLVMKDGMIVQAGSPEEIFARPSHPFVGMFVGSPGMNFFKTTIHPDGLTLHSREYGIFKPETWQSKEQANNGELLAGIRPQHVKVVEKSADKPSGFRISGTVRNIQYKSACKILEIETQAQQPMPIKVSVPTHVRFKHNQELCLELPFEQISLFPDHNINDISANKSNLWD